METGGTPWWCEEKQSHLHLAALFLYWPTTVGSKSTITARGTCFPVAVSLKNVVKESSQLSLSCRSLKVPSGWMPCSRQKSSQHAFPIWTPAWPTWTEMHSRYGEREEAGSEKTAYLSRPYFLLLLNVVTFSQCIAFPKNQWIVTVSCSFGCSAPWPQWDCTCQIQGWFFKKSRSVCCAIEVYENGEEKLISVTQTPPFLLDWPCWGAHPGLVYFYSWLEPDTATWHPSPLRNPRQVMSFDPSTLWLQASVETWKSCFQQYSPKEIVSGFLGQNKCSFQLLSSH